MEDQTQAMDRTNAQQQYQQQQQRLQQQQQPQDAYLKSKQQALALQQVQQQQQQQVWGIRVLVEGGGRSYSPAFVAWLSTLSAASCKTPPLFARTTT